MADFQSLKFPLVSAYRVTLNGMLKTKNEAVGIPYGFSLGRLAMRKIAETATMKAAIDDNTVPVTNMGAEYTDASRIKTNTLIGRLPVAAAVPMTGGVAARCTTASAATVPAQMRSVSIAGRRIA